MSARDVIETLAILLAAGLVAELPVGLLRLPRMVVLLGAGVLLGPEAPDTLDLPLDSVGVQPLLMLGASFVLIHGGLDLYVSVLRPVALGIGLPSWRSRSSSRFLLQATTKPWLARRLGLEEPEADERHRRAARSA